MSRSFTSQDLVQLPRLGASEAAVLITEIFTVIPVAMKAAKLKELPPGIERSRGRLTAAHVALDQEVQPQAGTDTQSRRKADRVIDNAWSAAFDWLSGWCKLPVERNPHLADSKALFNLVFAAALGFTKLPYKIEWQESKLRLDAIERDGHDKTFKALGGASFLAHIVEAHAAYGAALHITAAKPAGAAADVRGKLDAALAALRDYATRVVAYADPDVAGSEALSAALLEPLARWESTHGSGGGADEAEPAAHAEGGAGPVAVPQNP